MKGLMAVFILLVVLGLSLIIVGEDSCNLIYRDPRLLRDTSKAEGAWYASLSWETMVYLHANDSLSIRVSFLNKQAVVRVAYRVEDVASGKSWSSESLFRGEALLPVFIAPSSSVYRVFLSVKPLSSVNGSREAVITLIASTGSRQAFKSYYVSAGLLLMAPGALGSVVILAGRRR